METHKKRLKEYVVSVGNVGNVTQSTKKEALETFNEYVRQSERGFGRAGGEDVTLFYGDDILKEHFGHHNEYSQGGKIMTEELKTWKDKLAKAKTNPMLDEVNRAKLIALYEGKIAALESEPEAKKEKKEKKEKPKMREVKEAMNQGKPPIDKKESDYDKWAKDKGGKSKSFEEQFEDLKKQDKAKLKLLCEEIMEKSEARKAQAKKSTEKRESKSESARAVDTGIKTASALATLAEKADLSDSKQKEFLALMKQLMAVIAGIKKVLGGGALSKEQKAAFDEAMSLED